MPMKPIELPPHVAKAFVRDMRAFFKAKDQLKRDEIAARQGWLLPRGAKAADRRHRDVLQMNHA
jgi:hypothetical protein